MKIISCHESTRFIYMRLHFFSTIQSCFARWPGLPGQQSCLLKHVAALSYIIYHNVISLERSATHNQQEREKISIVHFSLLLTMFLVLTVGSHFGRIKPWCFGFLVLGLADCKDAVFQVRIRVLTWWLSVLVLDDRKERPNVSSSFDYCCPYIIIFVNLVLHREL